MKQPSNPPDRFLKIGEAIHVTGLSRSQLYRLAKQGDFPGPVKLGLRASGFLQSEVDAWVRRRVEASRVQE